MSEQLMSMVMYSCLSAMIGIACLALGKKCINDIQKREAKYTTMAYARVVDLISEVDRNSDEHKTVMWCPVFEYYVNGSVYTKQHSRWSSSRKYAIGQELVIYCDPQNPTDYCIFEEEESYSTSKLLYTVGIIAIVISIACAIYVIIN